MLLQILEQNENNIDISEQVMMAISFLVLNPKAAEKFSNFPAIDLIVKEFKRLIDSSSLLVHACGAIGRLAAHSQECNEFLYHAGACEPVMLAFKMFNCWPGAYGLSDLNAGDNGIMVQQMNIHHEGFYVEWDPTKIDTLAAR